LAFPRSSDRGPFEAQPGRANRLGTDIHFRDHLIAAPLKRTAGYWSIPVVPWTRCSCGGSPAVPEYRLKAWMWPAFGLRASRLSVTPLGQKREAKQLRRSDRENQNHLTRDSVCTGAAVLRAEPVRKECGPAAWERHSFKGSTPSREVGSGSIVMHSQYFPLIPNILHGIETSVRQHHYRSNLRLLSALLKQYLVENNLPMSALGVRRGAHILRKIKANFLTPQDSKCNFAGRTICLEFCLRRSVKAARLEERYSEQMAKTIWNKTWNKFGTEYPRTGGKTAY
jgi:hypothetical protein